MKLKLTLLILTLLCMPIPKALSTYVDAQSGSLMGLVHVSMGKQFFNHHYFSSGLGYVPKLDNHSEMSMFSVRYRYQHPYRPNIYKHFTMSPINLGLGILVASHKDLFVELPNQYPDDYYHPTATRVIINYQNIIHLAPRMELYFDLSILDVGLISYVRQSNFFRDNYRYLGLEGITNWGFGLRHRF